MEAALLREVREEIGLRLQRWEQVAVVPLLDQPQPNVSFVFHPPFLYLGYVGFSVAYSFAVAALISGMPGLIQWLHDHIAFNP
ncbi:hypothetical protein WCLP8_4560004 [uncultured Gammaproteobacteria bacterium]